jgi:glycosyltransferase involved in cell wall biosynthesis
MQVISALRKAGHRVTFSMPLQAHLSKTYARNILPQFTEEEIWCSENFFEPELVLNRLAPDIAIYCNVNCFRTIKRFAKEIVHVVDLYGPLQLEGLLLETADYEAAIRDGRLLETRCREMVERFRDIDYLITVSERQKYFWSAYCTLAGFSLADLNVLVCPVSFETPSVNRNTTAELTVVYSGGFYPWQNPDRALRKTAKLLQQFRGARLHIFGGPHAGLPNERDVYQMLEELQQSPCVKYHGYRPVEELVATLSTAWCALELMEQNLERELAITGRTVEFLSTGTPVIYNDYSTLSKLIRDYNAGWTVSPSDSGALERVFQELVNGGHQLVDRLSTNARRLATEQFSTETSMSALLNLCEGGIRKRMATSPSWPVLKRSKADDPFRVLAISPDGMALLDLRVNNPLRALQRQGFISGFRTTGTTFDSLLNDGAKYDAVLIQRAVPEYVYAALNNVGIPFIQDIDDNLLACAAYRPGWGAETTLVSGLKHARVVTAPNPRLVRLLEKYSKIQLTQRAFITPNALPFSVEAPPPSEPRQIIWIQSDIAALTTSRQDVIRAVEDFSQRHRLPIVLIGRNVLDRPQFTHQIVMGEIDFSANLQFLEFTSTSIGVAPLETAADEETLDFVAGKSDLKIVLFDGYGHPGVYSNAPPYGDSPFRAGVKVIQNSYGEWIDALEYQFREGWQSASGQSKRIRSERHIDRVARESWLPALQAARLAKSVSGAELYEAFRSFYEMQDSASANMAYLVANEDVAFGYVNESRSPWNHFEQHGQAEKRQMTHDPRALDSFLSKVDRESTEISKYLGNGHFQREPGGRPVPIGFESDVNRLRREIADLRNSLSWKITAPLRRIAKPLMERNGR